MNDKPLRVLASIGLAVGGALGMAGTFAPSALLRGLAWGIDGVALVMASALLAVLFFRRGKLRTQRDAVTKSGVGRVYSPPIPAAYFAKYAAAAATHGVPLCFIAP